MKKKLMSPMEVERAAMNLRNIERSLGHKVPYGTLDVTELGDKIYGPMESEYMAMNIRNIENAANRDSGLQFWIDTVFVVSTLIYIAAAIIYTIF